MLQTLMLKKCRREFSEVSQPVPTTLTTHSHKSTHTHTTAAKSTDGHANTQMCVCACVCVIDLNYVNRKPTSIYINTHDIRHVTYIYIYIYTYLYIYIYIYIYRCASILSSVPLWLP